MGYARLRPEFFFEDPLPGKRAAPVDLGDPQGVFRLNSHNATLARFVVFSKKMSLAFDKSNIRMPRLIVATPGAECWTLTATPAPLRHAAS